MNTKPSSATGNSSNKDSRKLSDKRFYRPTFRMHLTNKEILDKLLSYSEDLKHHYNLYQLLLFSLSEQGARQIFGLIEDNLKAGSSSFFRLSLKPSSRIKRKLSTPFNYPIPTPNWKRPIISSNLSNEMPLVFGTLKTSKKRIFYRSQYQKKKGRNVSFLDLSFSSTHYSKEWMNSVIHFFKYLKKQDQRFAFYRLMNYLAILKYSRVRTSCAVYDISLSYHDTTLTNCLPSTSRTLV